MVTYVKITKKAILGVIMSKASNLLSRLSETVYSGDAHISELEDDLISLGWSDDSFDRLGKP